MMKIDYIYGEVCARFNEIVKPAITWMGQSIKKSQNMDLMVDFCRFNYYMSYYLKLMDIADYRELHRRDIERMVRMMRLYQSILKTSDTDKLAAIVRKAMPSIIADMAIDYCKTDPAKALEFTEDNLDRLKDMEDVDWTGYESYAIPVINTVLHEVDGKITALHDVRPELLASNTGSFQYLAYTHMMSVMENAAQSHILFEEIQEKLNANTKTVGMVYERETAV